MIDPRAGLLRIWAGRRGSARAARIALGPLSGLYRAVSAVRGALYDRGILSAHQSSIPVVSVGNLTVGGTGKTPVAAWLAGQLRARGIQPAIVLRGYGNDEPLVHKRLNPDVEVVVCRDRARGIREAVAWGADAVILDDGFQHRRAARDLDLLLISADGWSGDVRLLPAGPWREPLTAAKRASLIILTCKTASPAKVETLRRAVSAAAPLVPQAVARLAGDELCSTATGSTMPLAALSGATVLAIAAIANPEIFFDQLTALGAAVTERPFADHHDFSAREAASLAAAAESADFAICTLKDAVKLEQLWPPRGGALWYVSQRVSIEEGRRQLDSMLDRL